MKASIYLAAKDDEDPRELDKSVKYYLALFEKHKL